VSVKEITERKPIKIKNFGIWLRYDSGTSPSLVIPQCYREMGARHRARAHAIQIIR
jgi:large subunit ribosomal protein L18Ae